jgi:hypothetical protein
MLLFMVHLYYLQTLPQTSCLCPKKDDDGVRKGVPEAIPLWIFSEIIPFQTSLDLSIDLGLMWHLITHTCSE